jgi:hypothetical protein
MSSKVLVRRKLISERVPITMKIRIEKALAKP